jgi:hypothetical protein
LLADEDGLGITENTECSEGCALIYRQTMWSLAARPWINWSHTTTSTEQQVTYDQMSGSDAGVGSERSALMIVSQS